MCEFLPSCRSVLIIIGFSLLCYLRCSCGSCNMHYDPSLTKSVKLHRHVGSNVADTSGHVYYSHLTCHKISCWSWHITQEPYRGPDSELLQSRPYCGITLKIHFKIILPPMRRCIMFFYAITSCVVCVLYLPSTSLSLIHSVLIKAETTDAYHFAVLYSPILLSCSYNRIFSK